MGIGATVALIKALAPATNPAEIEQIEEDVSDLKNAIQGMSETEPLANIYVPQDMANVLEGYILKKGVPQTQYGSSFCVTDYILSK